MRNGRAAKIAKVVINHGGGEVTLRPQNSGKTWCVSWGRGAARQRRYFAGEAAARAEGERIAALLGGEGGHLAGIPREDLEVLRACRVLLGGTTLSEVLDFYIKNRGSSEPLVKIPVGAAVPEYLAARQQAGASKRYAETLVHHLGRFAMFFPRMLDEITRDELEKYLGANGWGATTRNNHRASLIQFFQWARTKGYLAKGRPTEAEELPKAIVRNKTPETFTPEEFQTLLINADWQTTIYLVLAGLAGMRSSEILRLRWENIAWGDRIIRLNSEITKTSCARTVPLPAQLGELVKAGRDLSGDIIETRDIHYSLRNLAKNCGIPWRHNALRHSFASYHLALHGDAGRTATICGHSVAVLNRHYKDLKTKTDAEKWFSRTPTLVNP